MSDASPIIGQPLDRTDGALKTTGGARYAAEFRLPGLCHAVMVLSTVPRGRLVNLDTTRAERAPGVLLVLSHRNAPSLPEHGPRGVQSTRRTGDVAVPGRRHPL